MEPFNPRKPFKPEPGPSDSRPSSSTQSQGRDHQSRTVTGHVPEASVSGATAGRTLSASGRTSTQVHPLLDEKQLDKALRDPGQNPATLLAQNPNMVNQRVRNALHLACRWQLTSKLQELIDAGVDINARDHSGDSPLHLAIRHQCGKEAISVLLSNRASVDATNRSGDTPLHEALKADRSDDTCQLLMSERPDLNIRNQERKTTADIATEKLRHELAQLLDEIARSQYLEQPTRVRSIAPGTQPLTRITHSQYQLHEAVMHLLPSEQIEELLRSGWLPNQPDNEGRTPLHHAIDKRSVRTFHTLLNYGGDPAIQDSHGISIIKLAARQGRLDLISLFSQRGFNCWQLCPELENELCIAAQKGSLVIDPPYGQDILSELVQRAIEREDIHNLPVLLKRLSVEEQKNLCFRSVSQHSPAITRLMLELMLRIGECFTDHKGRSVLHELLAYKHTELADWLLTQKPEWINFRDSSGQTPLHVSMSSKTGSQIAVKTVLEFNPDLDARDKDGNTPMHLGLAGRSIESYQLVIAAGAQPYIENNKGESVLLQAARQGRFDLLTECQKKGFDWTKHQKLSNLAWDAILHRTISAPDITVMNRFAQIIKDLDNLKALIACGFDPTEVDAKGRTTLSYLVEKGQMEFIEFIIEDAIKQSNVQPPLTRAQMIQRLLPVQGEQAIKLMQRAAYSENRETLRFVLNEAMPAELKQRPANTEYGNLTLILLNDDKHKLASGIGYMVQNPWADLIIFDRNKEGGELSVDALRIGLDRPNWKNCKFVVDGHGPNLFKMHGANFAALFDDFLTHKRFNPQDTVKIVLYGCSTGKPLLEASEQDFIIQFMLAMAHNHQRFPVVTAASEKVFVNPDGETFCGKSKPRAEDEPFREMEYWEGGDCWLDPDYQTKYKIKGTTKANRRTGLIKEYEFIPGTGICEHNKHRGGATGGLHSIYVPGDDIH